MINNISKKKILIVTSALIFENVPFSIEYINF
jgi:hypothetical protein